MASQVDFYILESDSRTQAQHFLCRLVEKIYRKKRHIYVKAQDKKQSEEIDQVLWTYREDSFIPHNLVGEGPEPAPPVQISHELAPAKKDVLINLSPTIPEPTALEAYSRVLEVVSNTPEEKQSARERFSEYRRLGHRVKHHPISI